MKFLIWFVTLLVVALITTAASFSNISLGAIPTILLYGLAFWIARTLCKNHDEKTGANVVPAVHIDANRDKDSPKLGQAPEAPFCTKRRYWNNDWTTIERYLEVLLCGKNGEALSFKYCSTTTIYRSSNNWELIYIFDSFTKNGEKYSELYVCDEYDDETTVPPVGYRFAKELTVSEDGEAKAPAFSLSTIDANPTTTGDFHICSSDVLLEQPDETSSYCLSDSTDEPLVPYGNGDIFVRDFRVQKSLNSNDQQPSRDISVDTPPADSIPEVRFCRKCGAKLIPNSRFCSQCGTEIVRE